ncbi:hypothetical protein H9P43_005235 [Blastocladiella emersonii ATCC 22665]|nr:hypothetical protein H9P43_005235 [Blastocladiella emersonii ATCC 22665]
MSVREVGNKLLCSHSTISRWVVAYRAGGVAAFEPVPRPPRETKLDADDDEFVRAAITSTPWLTLRDLSELLRAERNKSVSVSTLSRLLDRLGFSKKVVKSRGANYNEEARAAWRQYVETAGFRADQLVFCDECGIQPTAANHRFAWSETGVPAVIVQPRAPTSTRVNLVAAISTLGPLLAHAAPLTQTRLTQATAGPAACATTLDQEYGE